MVVMGNRTIAKESVLSTSLCFRLSPDWLGFTEELIIIFRIFEVDISYSENWFSCLKSISWHQIQLWRWDTFFCTFLARITGKKKTPTSILFYFTWHLNIPSNLILDQKMKSCHCFNQLLWIWILVGAFIRHRQKT